MPLPDNRIRLPATKIDFTTDVGVASQDHDDYPPAQGQARFDHMRMFLIGLLSQQSSFDEPTEKRDGTPWFDLNTLQLKIWSQSQWMAYGNAIALAEDGDGNVTETLQSWYNDTASALNNLASEIFFHGSVTQNNVNSINIPESVRSSFISTSRCFVYKNGVLLNPTNCQLNGSPPSSITLLADTLNNGDTYMVTSRSIPSQTFLTTAVNIP